MKSGDDKEMRCISVIASHCCNIPEKKDVLMVKHGMFMGGQCIPCLALLDDVKELQMARCCTIQDTEAA